MGRQADAGVRPQHGRGGVSSRDVAHSHGVPLRGGYSSHLVDSRDPGEVAGDVDDRQCVACPRPHRPECLHQLLHSPPLRGGELDRRHELADRHSVESLRAVRGSFSAGRSADEPPNQHQPEATDTAEQHVEQPQTDQHRAERPTEPGHGVGGCVPIVVAPPQQGVQQPPPVQRHAGQQVEHCEQQIHLGEPGRRRTR
jgi:hypothetical protein